MGFLLMVIITILCPPVGIGLFIFSAVMAIIFGIGKLICLVLEDRF